MEIRRAHGDDVGVVQCLERIGIVQRHMGRRREALSTLDEAVAIASRLGDRLGLANALHATGFIQIELSDFDKAADALSEGITITRNIGWEGGLSTSLRTMGRLKMRLGDHREVEELLQESISTARHIQDRYRLTQALDELGKCFRQQSKLNEAAPLLEEACLLWRELSEEGVSKGIASTLVELKSRQGDWDRVLFWRDHIIAVCRSQKDYWGVANQLERKGEILVKAQRYDEAALHFEAAIVTAKENGYTWRSNRKQLCTIPKVEMKWERRLRLLFDVKKLQRRLPQLVTASLKLPILDCHGQP
ncbi:hypothetical protein M407DRAFT_23074 [Tulasnella calospora MUT 4182]|uniref:MalT-like TPR region domain-containing protein n=1 Tax=Tulasnella calospora MUT 4182 TaxID=1051891 RepID=A0A0C3L1M7_9AGAM|nr:hypothetical protein M407DRAFT_23074 [Tulasnella calospora MUT 4182]